MDRSTPLALLGLPFFGVAHGGGTVASRDEPARPGPGETRRGSGRSRDIAALARAAEPETGDGHRLPAGKASAPSWQNH